MLVLERQRQGLDQIEESFAAGSDVSTVLQVVRRPKLLGCSVVTFVEQRVERLQDEFLILLGCRLHRDALVLDPRTVCAAARITSMTKPGLESMGTWLLSTSKTAAPIRFATKRCSSGWTVRSLLATMYQLGFDLQAVPSSFWLNRSAAGAN